VRSRALLSVVLLVCAGQSGCRSSSEDHALPSLQLQSPAFSQSDAIPKQFTCDGPNVSPALAWQPPPAGTQSLALILNDQSSTFHAFVHWVLYNLPSDSRTLPEGVVTQEQLADGSRQGWNDNNSVGYWGPCPPGKSPHHYLFTLYALDSKLVLPSRADEKQLRKAMKGHILAAGRLMGTYRH
jgi:Raf kinase inhibitor-like YbhB/YbcL family protein